MRPYLLSGWLLLLACTLQAQGAWKLEKEREGIQVYTRSVPGSTFREFKVTATVEVSANNLVAVLKDVGSFQELFDRTTDARLLKTSGETRHIHYAYTDGPWPVADRDGIYEYRYRYEAADRSVVVDIQCLPEFLPAEPGVVRIEHCRGEWRFRSLAAERTEITYQFFADPGGNLPAWIVNWSTVDIPFQAIVKLREMAVRPAYRNHVYPFSPPY